MVVGYFNIVGVAFDETEANAPLIVYGYRVLACSITF